jgi:protein-disulfide isomerase
VRLVFKDRPLGGHALARRAHEAARCAGAAGKYWEYHDLLFEEQPAFERANLLLYAADVGLDAADFARCLDERRYARDVDADIEQAVALGIRATPTLLVNGRRIVGAPTLEAFRSLVEDALRERR